MQQVPTLVRDEDGDPIHHGIVERAFDKLRQIIQRYVLDKQEAHVVCILPAVCTFATRTSYIHDGSCIHEVTTIHPHAVCCPVEQHCTIAYSLVYIHRVREEIKFGDASPVIRKNRDKIVYDEFEFDQTSMRRTLRSIAYTRC